MSKEAIETLINSLSKKHIEKGIEIIIVNNGSTDQTADGIEELKTMYQSDYIDIIALNLQENMGYPVGINLGLAKCSGEIIAVLNNDLIFPPDWFDGLVNTLEMNQEIGMVAPYLSYASGPQNVGVRFDSIKEIYNFAEKFMKENHQRTIHALRIIGACYVIRRETFNKIGGNDFWFGIGICDDDDLSLRIAIAGYKLAIVGSSFVYHLGTISFNQKVHDLNCALGINHQKFSLKWDLKPHGEYESREDIQNKIKYNNKNHYFPTKIEEFSGAEPPLMNKDVNHKKALLVADWTNPRSRWKEKLNSYLENISPGEKLYLWIPENYYIKKEISANIERTITSEKLESKYIKLLNEEISPLDLLKLIYSFDSILTVSRDFVNRYIAYLANEISIPRI